MRIPVIDITAEAAAPWDAAMRESGFALIAGHDIAEDLLDGLYAHAQAFFARPLDQKLNLTFAERGRGQGYLPLRSEIVGNAPNALPDLCESLTFAHPRFDAAEPDNELDARLYRANLWPGDMPEFREALLAYFAAGRALALKLMRLSARALDLPPDHFAPYFDKMELNLRCVNYPGQLEAPRENELRYGPHTDFSGFTILRQDAAPGGLQVKSGAEWIDVPPMAGTLVVNAGDLIQRWTNDRWNSSIHRVMNPPREPTTGTRRLSIVLFTGPNSDAEIACLPGCGPAHYPPILAGRHCEERMRQTYGRQTT